MDFQTTDGDRHGRWLDSPMESNQKTMTVKKISRKYKHSMLEKRKVLHVIDSHH
jgi:Mg/Co/Ni transporter MgtE